MIKNVHMCFVKGRELLALVRQATGSYVIIYNIYIYMEHGKWLRHRVASTTCKASRSDGGYMRYYVSLFMEKPLVGPSLCLAGIQDQTAGRYWISLYLYLFICFYKAKTLPDILSFYARCSHHYSLSVPLTYKLYVLSLHRRCSHH